MCVPPEETVLGLKQVLSRKFKLPSDRIHLLFKDRYVLLWYPIYLRSCKLTEQLMQSENCTVAVWPRDPRSRQRAEIKVMRLILNDVNGL